MTHTPFYHCLAQSQTHIQYCRCLPSPQSHQDTAHTPAWVCLVLCQQHMARTVHPPQRCHWRTARRQFGLSSGMFQHRTERSLRLHRPFPQGILHSQSVLRLPFCLRRTGCNQNCRRRCMTPHRQAEGTSGNCLGCHWVAVLVRRLHRTAFRAHHPSHRCVGEGHQHTLSKT